MMEDWDFEDWEPIAAGGDRGLTQGYAPCIRIDGVEGFLIANF